MLTYRALRSEFLAPDSSKKEMRDALHGSASRDEASANIGLDPRRKRSAFDPRYAMGLPAFDPRHRQKKKRNPKGGAASRDEASANIGRDPRGNC